MKPKKGEPCILYNRKCIECNECEMCDLDPTKKCNNCGECIEYPETDEKGYAVIKAKISKTNNMSLDELLKAYGLDSIDDE